jgi:hypothetical protein
MKHGCAAAAIAAAFRDLPRRRRGSRDRNPFLRIPVLRKDQRDCFVGASLTAAPAYAWQVA